MTDPLEGWGGGHGPFYTHTHTHTHINFKVSLKYLFLAPLHKKVYKLTHDTE